MKKRKTALLIVGALAFCAFAGTIYPNVHPCAHAQENKTAEETALTPEITSLFLPKSYEQYLPLENPSHVAFSESYIAVAEGATLYLYNRAEKVYTQYEHKTGSEQAPTIVSELQFSSDGTLFFTDQRTSLYAYDPHTNQAQRQAISCSTFLIAEDNLYYATTTTGANLVTFYYAPLGKLDEEDVSTRIGQDNLKGFSPHLAYEDGVLQCVFNDNLRMTYDTANHAVLNDHGMLNANLAQITGLNYVCAIGGNLYYTVNNQGTNENDGLYRTDGDGNAKLILACDDLSTLAVEEQKLYCVQGNSVKEIAFGADGAFFTGYEIAASSSSYNRLSGAADGVRAGNLLVTADQGNNRVSVHNFKTNEYSSFEMQNVCLVATDGDTIAATDGHTVVSLRYADLVKGELSDAKYNEVRQGRVTGLVCLFTKVYFVTENSAYGLVGEEPVFYSDYGVPNGMTRDLYGKIYVSYKSGGVYAFEERHFTQESKAIKVSVTLPADHTSFRSDFEGNLYCLSGNKLFKNGEAIASLPTSTPFVYRGSTAPVCFALGFEDDGVYFCFGDYIVVSNAGTLDIPTLDKIDFGSAKEQLYDTNVREDILVTVAENAVGIEIDLTRMQSAEAYFPYAGYARKESANGVKIAETDQYELVLLGKDGDYSALLFRKESVTPVAREDYYRETTGIYYLSNAVNAVHHPCMEATLARFKADRGLEVSKKAVLSMSDREYALVAFTYENTEYTAYVPLCYLSEIPPLGAAHDRYTLGYLKKGETVFSSQSGEELTVTERTRVRLYKTDDGYLAQFEKDGTLYSASVTEKMIENGNNDALRISLIVILSVLAVLIVGVYIYLLPLRKK